MRHYGLVAILGFCLTAASDSAVRAGDSGAYLVESPDILRLVVTGLPKKAQPVKGEFLVRPDGTIGLGTYGSVTVSGLTLDKARAAIVAQLATQVKQKQKEAIGAQVEVKAYNSKHYFVVWSGDAGEQVVRLPYTGSETILDALPQVKGMAELAAKTSVSIARPTPSSGKPNQILPVDYVTIARYGRTTTNYQILPNDRIYVGTSPAN